MGGREVVITGTGLITPLGKGVDENWHNIKAMKTGIAQHRHGLLPHFLQYMGKVGQFDIDGALPHKLLGQVKFLNRSSLLGFMAAREALYQAGINLSGIPPGRRSLYIASGDMTKVGYDFMYPATKEGTHGRWLHMDSEKLNQSALDKVNPFFLLESINNNLFSFLSAFLEFMGPNTSLASHSPCGGNAVELAFRNIRQGKADVSMAVGCGNWITEVPLYEMAGLGILSQCRQGAQSFRPFDKRRDGFIPGEGGAALLLEAHDIAAERGAIILGQIKGSGNSIEFSGGQGIAVPSSVSRQSMMLALEDAGCAIGDMAFISPHGSGSQKGDRSELRSMVEIHGGKGPDTPVCALKPYTGHLGAASDISEVVVGIKAAAENLVPATLNYTESEKEFRCMKISGSHQQCDREHFLSVSYGMGGQSSCLVVQVRK